MDEQLKQVLDAIPGAQDQFDSLTAAYMSSLNYVHECYKVKFDHLIQRLIKGE